MANLRSPACREPAAGHLAAYCGAAGLAVNGAAVILRYIISPFHTVGEYERTVVTRFGRPRQPAHFPR